MSTTVRLAVVIVSISFHAEIPAQPESPGPPESCCECNVVFEMPVLTAVCIPRMNTAQIHNVTHASYIEFELTTSPEPLDPRLDRFQVRLETESSDAFLIDATRVIDSTTYSIRAREEVFGVSRIELLFTIDYADCECTEERTCASFPMKFEPESFVARDASGEELLTRVVTGGLSSGAARDTGFNLLKGKVVYADGVTPATNVFVELLTVDGVRVDDFMWDISETGRYKIDGLGIVTENYVFPVSARFCLNEECGACTAIEEVEDWDLNFNDRRQLNFILPVPPPGAEPSPTPEPSCDQLTVDTEDIFVLAASWMSQTGSDLVSKRPNSSPRSKNTYRKMVESNSWSARAPMPTPRRGFGAGAINGRIYAFGGRNQMMSVLAVNEEYDPVSNTWRTRSPMPGPRRWFAAAEANNQLFAIGGDDASRTLVATNESYDPVTDTWQRRPPMPTARGFATATSCGGEIFVIGGVDHMDSPFSNNESFDPLSNRWCIREPLPTPTFGGGAGAARGRIYYIGGLFEDPDGLSGTYEYDPAVDNWQEKTPLPTPRAFLSVINLNERIFAVGGGIGGRRMATNEEYDSSTDTWTARATMSTPRDDFGVAVLDSRIYAIGGRSDDLKGSTFLAATEVYAPPPVDFAVDVDRNGIVDAKDLLNVLFGLK